MQDLRNQHWNGKVIKNFIDAETVLVQDERRGEYEALPIREVLDEDAYLSYRKSLEVS